jgi:hypothetical protein
MSETIHSIFRNGGSILDCPISYSVHDYYLQGDTELHGCAGEGHLRDVVEALGDITWYRFVSTSARAAIYN